MPIGLLKPFILLYIEIFRGIYNNNKIKQDGDLHPPSFITFMEVLRIFSAKNNKLKVCHWKLNRVHVSKTPFADDVVLIFKTKENWKET